MLATEDLELCPAGFRVSSPRESGVFWVKAENGTWRGPDGRETSSANLNGYEPVPRVPSAALAECQGEFTRAIRAIASREGEEEAGEGALWRLGLLPLDHGVHTCRYLWFLPPGSLIAGAPGSAPLRILTSPGLGPGTACTVQNLAGVATELNISRSYQVRYVPPFLPPPCETPAQFAEVVWETLANLKQRHGWCGAVDAALERARLTIANVRHRWPEEPAPVHVRDAATAPDLDHSNPGTIIRVNGATLVRVGRGWVDTSTARITHVSPDATTEVIYDPRRPTNTADEPLGTVLRLPGHDFDYAVKVAVTEPMWQLNPSNQGRTSGSALHTTRQLDPAARVSHVWTEGVNRFAERFYYPLGTRMRSGGYARIRRDNGWVRNGGNSTSGTMAEGDLGLHTRGDGQHVNAPEMAFVV